jgi:hypothetical protein
MPRGGRRENAGRKSIWKHRETTVIRVPKAFAEELLEIAQKLDSGEDLEFVPKSKARQIEKVTQSKLKNDSVIQSKNGQLELVTESKKLQPLSSRALGRRLGISKNSIASRRDDSDVLFKWTEERDPDNIGWRYNSSDKKYYPIENVT